LVAAGVGLGIAVAGQAKHRTALAQLSAGEGRAAAQETESASAHQKTTGYWVLGGGSAAAVAGAILFLTARAAPSPNAPAAGTAGKGWSCSPWFMSSLLGASLQTHW
jgi:hypothetical protein